MAAAAVSDLSAQPDRRQCIVLFSGGLDSTTLVAIAQAEGYAVRALSFDYGQRHGVELAHARRVAAAMGCLEHRVLALPLGELGGSVLTDEGLVPKDTPLHAIGGRVPPTYVPARNTVFLSLALAWAEVLGALDIFLGANQVDYSGYPDCRPAFVDAFERLANLACVASVDGGKKIRIHAPLMQLGKGDIIQWGLSLRVDYATTFSCYDPVDGLACGRCEACALRRAGFDQAGVEDPTRYTPDASRATARAKEITTASRLSGASRRG